MDRYFMLCIFIIWINNATGFDPVPCCTIVDLDVTGKMPNFFTSDTIFFTRVPTCGGSCTGKLKHREGQSTRATCINGFNVLSFVLNILYNMGDLKTPEENELYNKVKDLLDAFFSVFAPNTSHSNLTIVTPVKPNITRNPRHLEHY